MLKKMITVQININGNCILARSATRVAKYITPEKKEMGRYKTDCGKTITHPIEEGAVELAHKLLNCIKEQK